MRDPRLALVLFKLSTNINTVHEYKKPKMQPALFFCLCSEVKQTQDNSVTLKSTGAAQPMFVA